jgi:hypothetical protein
MPEFQMPFESNADLKTFQDLDEFTQGYLQALFFTECHSDNPELEDATFADLAPESLSDAISECAQFQADNKGPLNLAYSRGSYDAAQAGRDYWFTRNGHGVGFWDRGLGHVGETLSDACRYAEVDVYRGDDGKVHLS